MGTFRDLTGLPFDRWTVIERGPNKRNEAQWWCLCSCGTKRLVITRSLVHKVSKSCGCLRIEALVQRATKHGSYQSTEYKIWLGMKDRCLNPRNEGYKDYGGRGITICQRWLNSFENFLADMELRPSPEHSLDRYPDNDGPYSPDNCRWATLPEQARNTRKNRMVTLHDETHCLTDWAHIKGIEVTTIYDRLARGWSIEKALTTPVVDCNRPITIDGETHGLQEWLHIKNLAYGTFNTRVQRGWSVEKALTTPALHRTMHGWIPK